MRLLTALFITFTAVQIGLAQSQLEITGKYCAIYEKTDAELNKVYQKVLQVYQTDAVFVEKMKKSQRAWIAFRDAHLDSLYPAEDSREYGSMFGMCYCQSQTEITQKRIAELKVWLDGVEEGG
jgi:uncharacterized protein YecT (DUF1311 family)